MKVNSIIVSISTFLSMPGLAAVDYGEQVFDCMLEPSMISDVGSSVPGILSLVSVERGQTINKGEIIAKLESSVEEKSLLLKKYRASSDVSTELHRVMSEFGDRSNQRSSVLASTSAISEQDLDQIETDSIIARMRLKKERENRFLAKLEYDQAKAVVERKTILSPLTGVVMERFKSVGEFVDEKPIARVAQLHPLHVQAILPVELMGKLFVGQGAKIGLSVDNYDPKYQAEISLVDRVADAPSSTFSVRLSLDNKEFSIPAGVRCRVSFDQSHMGPDYTAGSNENRVDQLVDKAIEEAKPYDESSHVGISNHVQTKNTDSRQIATQKGDRLCVKLGPFTKRDDLLNLKEDMFEHGLDTEEMENEENNQYLVLSSSADMNISDINRLKELGINDLYLIASGDNAGRISFGLFAKSEVAENRQSQLVKRNIDTEIVPRKRTRRWLQASSVGTLQADLLRKLVSRWESSTKTKVADCDN